MRKEWPTLWIISTVIFVFCLIPIVYGQTKNPDSQAIIILEKMHEMENRIRDHIDKKFTDQNTIITNLGKDVAVNKREIEIMNNNIKDLQGTLTWIWRSVIGVILLNICWYLIQHYFLKSPNRQDQDTSEVVKHRRNSEKYTDNTQTDLKEIHGETA